MKQLSMLGIFLLWSVSAIAQQTISGKVLDRETGDPINYAEIITSNLRTVVDGNGNFSIEIEDQSTVQVRAIGYESTTLPAGTSGKITVELIPISKELSSVEVAALRATNDIPVARTDLSEADIENRDIARDMPYILENTPSVVTSSDAGAGIGYTGIRIRGSDQTRINVTVNGVPVNDAESQGVFWVNTPDLASSVSSLQVQRGVGTSTNGAGAFGASINMETKSFTKEAYADLHVAGGSFNTQRYSLNFGTGLINGHWTLDGRASKISSDGWIDRATSDLKSYYMALGYQTNNTTVKAVVFGGRERTYQAWYGTDSASYAMSPTFNAAGMYTDENGNVGYYNDQVDNYGQDYYQLHINHQLNSNWALGLSGFYTRGAGYYEEFEEDAAFGDYGLTPIIIANDTTNTTDLARRLWLDNHFYGVIANAHGTIGKLNLTLGGSWNQYKGDHYGRILWARSASNSYPKDNFYFNNSVKTNINAYVKADYAITDALQAYVDLQVRNVNYNGGGTEEENFIFEFEDQLTFFNPKAGLVYHLSENSRVFASYAMANREPNRVDYLSSLESDSIAPQPETLHDVEVGYEGGTENFAWNVNAFYMYYTNQLVLTGELNSVGAPIRKNVGKSYRAGIEISSTWNPIEQLTISESVSISDNKNIDYHEDIAGVGTVALGNTPIAFSPSVIANVTATFHMPYNLDLSINPRYVDVQYLSNNGREGLTLPAYFVTDLRLSGQWKLSGIKRLRAYVTASNIFSEEYAPNGYSYSYEWGGQQYYGMGFYPQAPINYMIGMEFSF